MIEIDILNYLKGNLEAPVEMIKLTDESINEYVLIEKTSSGRENYLNSAAFAIQSYSDTLYGAMSLNEQVKLALLGNGNDSYGIVAKCNNISKCSLNSDYNYTDTTRKGYRYQAVFDFIYMD